MDNSHRPEGALTIGEGRDGRGPPGVDLEGDRGLEDPRRRLFAARGLPRRLHHFSLSFFFWPTPSIHPVLARIIQSVRFPIAKGKRGRCTCPTLAPFSLFFFFGSHGDVFTPPTQTAGLFIIHRPSQLCVIFGARRSEKMNR
jgi:hypothetical protein